ncbi:MAG: hypothetical protein IPL16_11590 [Ignavibacteria bacterium]|nr:hypothetical protein [Ignavibacteria bacterium]MBK8382507.1 hypothetical protein [Ignavibacteria bacterium]
MIAIKGIYDGKKVIPLEPLPENKKYKILITLLEEFDSDEEIRSFTSQEDAFSFWYNEKENIYQDYILRDKK